ncbi:MAG: cytochrome c oxidase assembly protein [Microbacteriaceae bacterium]|nr:cytochrome c oxidase assembly protein [Microbacteriaceae bacterium]
MFLTAAPLAPPGLGEFLGLSATTSFVLPVAATALAAIYLLGAVTIWMRGHRWSVLRTVSFVLGCVVVAATTGSAVEDYSQVMLSVFMFEQLTLMMLAPPLLVLGSPGRLLLRSVHHRGLGRVALVTYLSVVRSAPARWILHPALSVAVFLLLFYGLYLGDLLDPILVVPGGHVSLEVVFLVAGILFTIPILSDDPLPIRMSHPARAVDLAAEVALLAFFGVFLMISPTLVSDYFSSPPPSLVIDPFFDQGLAGGLAWSYGTGPTLLLLLYILNRWFRDDTRRAAAADARSLRFGDPDLDAYNVYLARLRNRSNREEQGNTGAVEAARTALYPAEWSQEGNSR